MNIKLKEQETNEILSCSSHEIGDVACRKENQCLPWDFPPGVVGHDCNSSVILSSIHRPTCNLDCDQGYRAANSTLVSRISILSIHSDSPVSIEHSLVVLSRTLNRSTHSNVTRTQVRCRTL